MHPERELALIAQRKSVLQLRIALRRAECAHAAATVLRPLTWLDRAISLGRQISPYVELAAGPLASFFTRTESNAGRKFGWLFRLARLLVHAFRALTRAPQARSTPPAVTSATGLFVI